MPDASRSPRKKDARRITSNLLFLAFNHATAAICERCPAAVLKLKLPHTACDHFIVLHFFFFFLENSELSCDIMHYRKI